MPTKNSNESPFQPAKIQSLTQDFFTHLIKKVHCKTPLNECYVMKHVALFSLLYLRHFLNKRQYDEIAADISAEVEQAHQKVEKIFPTIHAASKEKH